MPTLTLTEAQQLALRALMSIEPTPGCSMPSPEVLRLIEKLVPCDAIGIGVVDNDGCVMEELVLRHDFTDEDLARLALVIPILQRLLRVRPTPHLPAALTVQERRVLMLVANGMSNPRHLPARTPRGHPRGTHPEEVAAHLRMCLRCRWARRRRRQPCVEQGVEDDHV